MAITAKKVLGSTAIIVPFAAAGVTLLRLYRATGDNISVTVTALGVVDRSALLLSTLLTSLILISAIAVLLSAYYLASRWPKKPVRTGPGDESDAITVARYFYPAVVSLTVGLAILLVMVPLVVVGAALVVCLAGAGLGLLMRGLFEDAGSSIRIPPARSRVQVVARAGYTSVVTLGVLTLTFMAAGVFSPQTFEQVSIGSGTYDRVWVMGSQDDQTLLMNDHREARWVKTSSITARRICAADSSESSWTHRSLVEIRSKPPTTTNLNDYTPCTHSA